MSNCCPNCGSAPPKFQIIFCDACGSVFTADAPPTTGVQASDPETGVQATAPNLPAGAYSNSAPSMSGSDEPLPMTYLPLAPVIRLRGSPPCPPWLLVVLSGVLGWLY